MKWVWGTLLVAVIMLGFTAPSVAADDCGVCTTIVSLAETLLKENSTVTEIESVLDKICSAMPADAAANCHNYVQEYLPVILEMVENDYTAQQICQKLNLCPAADGGAIECLICEELAKLALNLLQQNQTETKIIAELNKLCGKLHLGSKCTDIVDQYAPLLIQLLEQYENPDKACEQLHLCGNNSTAPVRATAAVEEWLTF